MVDKIVTFETAKLANEKGFDWSVCERLYNVYDFSELKEIKNISNNVAHPDYKNRFIPAPTQSLLQKWLRDIHNIYIDIETIMNENDEYEFIPSVIKLDIEEGGEECYFDTYEKALEDGLLEALKEI